MTDKCNKWEGEFQCNAKKEKEKDLDMIILLSNDSK